MPGHVSIIKTKRLLLRGIRKSDAAAIYAYASDPVVTRYVIWPTHTSLKDSKAYIRYQAKEVKSGKSLIYGIVLKETGEYIGSIGLHDINRTEKHAEAGYVIARQHWGKGYVPETLKAVMAFGFKKLKLVRIFAHSAALNKQSARVMEKAGMKFEGRMKKARYLKGRFWDVELRAAVKRGK